MSPQNVMMSDTYSYLSVKDGLKELQSVLEQFQIQEPKRTKTNNNTEKVQDSKKIQAICSSTHNPICVIRTLLFAEGKSMAYSNEETLSSSFLILNGFMTICLFDSTNKGESNSFDAKERWLKRLETNIYVGKVSYEYRSEDEDSAGDDARDDIDTTSVVYAHNASVLSQTLKRVPYVLDQEKSIKLADPKFKVPTGHQKFANALQAQQYHLAVEVYEDILDKDKNRYGKDDLVCAIDYHNLGIAYHMCGNFDRALSHLQKSVLLKRACVGHDDPIVADSLTEIGIIFYNNCQFESALAVFLEALGIYKDVRDNEGAGRIFNNIGCVYYRMDDRESSLKYLRFAADSQHMVLGTSETAEASLLSCALCQANVGLLKSNLGHLDATAMLEESLLVMESVLGDENLTVQSVRATIASIQ